MKTITFALCAALCLTVPAASAFAQSPDAAPGPAPAASDPGAGGNGGGGGAGAGGKGGKFKEAVKACREKAKADGLKGPQMKQAVVDCVGKDNPKMAETLKCRMAGKDKGLKPGTDEMKSFVKDCRKNGHS